MQPRREGDEEITRIGSNLFDAASGADFGLPHTHFWLLILLVPTLAAHPLTFEQRSPRQFVAPFGDTSAVLRPGAVSVGPITMLFRGSSTNAVLEGVGRSSPSTYLLPGFTRTYQQFPRLRERNLYPGIDAIYYGIGNHLEYDLVAAPHANIENIQLIFEGADRVRFGKYGGLLIESGSGVLAQHLPLVFQSNGPSIEARYVLLSSNRVAIKLGAHDVSQVLTIDPELAYTRYFGDSGTSAANLVATDAQGNLYLAGRTNAVDFPSTSAFPMRIAPPLVAISNAGQKVTPLPVGLEESVIAFAGTPDGSVIYALTPDAIFVSSDQGKTWQKRGSPFAALAGTPTIDNLADLAVDAIDPSRLFLATSAGLLFSSDGGQNWNIQDNGLPSNRNFASTVAWVAVSPADHAIVYAVTGQPTSLFKSTDGGNTWTQLNLPSPVVATLGANGSDLYVVDLAGLLYKSTDAGMTWILLSAGLKSAIAVAVDPNTSEIYVISGNGLQWSIDGGMTFASAQLQGTQLVPGGVVTFLEQLAVDGTGTVYVGTERGIYFSADRGVTLQPLPTATSNLHTLAASGGEVYAGFDTQAVPFVMKLDPTGTQILYSTFIGGSSYDSINGMAVDGQGNCTVVGYTYSSDFPTTVALSPASAAGQPSGFITKLSSDGSRLIYSASLGASAGVQSVSLDASGAAYVIGQAVAGFPTTPNAFQPQLPTSTCIRPQNPPFTVTNTNQYSFVGKLKPDGSAFAYATFLTGSCGSYGQGITVDAAGEAIVVGHTTSPDFPTSANAYQAAFPGPPDQVNPPYALTAGFVTKLSAAGDKVLASSYLGGGYTTQASAVAVDPIGNVSITGSTVKMLLGATPGAFQQKPLTTCPADITIGPALSSVAPTSFVLKLDPALSVADYLTYLGGSCSDAGTGIALDASGNAWVVGNTASADFPLRSPFQGSGISNGFVSEISTDGSQLLFSSLTDGAALALDSSGEAYLAGLTTSAAELVKIDPASTHALTIDNIAPVTVDPLSLGLNGIAPGQLIHITGRNLGPSTVTSGQVDATGRLSFEVANTSVFFDDIPAPVLSVQANAIECFAPFEIVQTTNVAVVSNGQKSNAVRMGAPASAPQILSITNQDGTPNSAGNPAKAGSVIMIYASGLGVTSPLSVDGLVNAAPLPVPVTPVIAYLGSVIVQPQFIGAAPGMIAGIVQMNLAVPLTAGAQSPVQLSLNDVVAEVYVSQ